MAAASRDRLGIGPAERLHGRMHEVRLLWEAFHRVQRGGVELVVLHGPAGVGKTRLVESLIEPMRVEGGRVSRGSWVRQRSGPFEGMLGALDYVVRGLLSEPEPTLAAMRVRLERELGEGLSLLTGLLPELELLTGPRPPPPAMAPQEAQQRFELLMHRLVRCFAAESAPLVLFLDDLHWAEPSSLRLLARLVESYDGPGLLIICALRSACEPPCLDLPAVRGALGAVSERACWHGLEALTPDEQRGMVAELLGSTPEAVAPLDQLVWDLCAGNPWAVQRFLVKLHAFGALINSDGVWSWRLEQARELAAVDSEPMVVDSTLANLPPETRELLELAACLGPELEGELLTRAASLEQAELEELLLPALRRGILLLTSPLPEYGSAVSAPRWRFAHDRLHQAVLRAIEPTELPSIRRRIVRRLRRAWKSDRSVRVLFTLADQLQQLPVKGEKPRTVAARVELLLEAGRQAVLGASWETAVRHLGAAIEAVVGRSSRAPQALELRTLMAQALQATGAFGPAEEQLIVAAELAAGSSARTALHVQHTGMLVQAARYLEAVDRAMLGLGELGLELPDRDDEQGWGALLGQEFGRQAALLGDRPVEALADSPAMPDGPAALELTLLGALAPPAYVFPAMMPWVVTRMVNLCLEHGNGPLAPLAFAFQGFLCCASGQAELGQAFGSLALDLERHRPDRSLYAPVIHLYVNFTNHWSRPVDSGLELGLRAVNLALQHGQFDYAGWLSFNGALALLYRGGRLDEAFDRCVGLLRVARDTLRYADAETVTAGVLQVLGRLLGREDRLRELGLDPEDPSELVGALEHYVVARAHVHLVNMTRSVLVGDFASARHHADALTPDLPGAAGLIGLVEFALYDTILRCHEHPDLDPEQQPENLERVRSHLAALEGWAASSPLNHAHKRALAVAELAALEGSHERATGAFVQAMEGAASQGYLQLEALACSRAARFHRAAGNQRSAALLDAAAAEAWERWGARPVTGSAMEGERSDDPDQRSEALARIEAAGKAARSLSDGLEPHRLALELAEQVVAFTGAQQGSFYLLVEGELVHVVSAGSVSITERSALPASEIWPSGLVRQVLEGQRSLGGGQAEAATWQRPLEGPAPRSWLCLPLGIDRRGGARGVLLLEHEVRAGAFSGVDHGALHALGSLAISALDDLGRYEDLARLSRALEASSSKLASHSASLQAEVLEWAGDLEALHEEHRSTLEALLDGVVRVDLQGLILYANPAAARITGFSAAELVGAHGTELLEPRDAGGAALRPDRPRQDLHRPSDAPFNAMLRRKDGDRVSVEFRWSPVFRPDGSIEGGVIAIRDTTQRQALEQQLRHAQKMEAMGRFAGGMAHDLNNLLTPIRGHLERIHAQAGGDRDLLRRAEAASGAAERATALVKQVLAFSRRAEVFKQPHNLVPIVDDVCQFLRRSTDRAIRLAWEPPVGDHWFLGDDGLVQQVLLNLGLNARHALEQAQAAGEGPAQPRITIQLRRSGREEVGPPLPRGYPNPSLVLTVSDNGVGMDAQTQARIFEPFFTTKPPDQGTGLGLSVVYGIIEQHGGRVTVHSAPGQGAHFTCFLPACEPRPAPIAAPALPDLTRGDARTILVVDDESAVRELAREVLEEFGYEVIEAPNGETALDIHGARGQELDLVLLDLSMPGISGPETLRRLRARDPALPVVLWSGYSAEDDLPASVGAEARAFLEKPFELSTLVLKVQQVLSSGEDGA